MKNANSGISCPTGLAILIAFFWLAFPCAPGGLVAGATRPVAEEAAKEKPASATKKGDAKTVSELVDRIRPALATIRSSGRDGRQYGVGTGFIISEDGLIATNLHVIGEGRRFTVELSGGRRPDVVAIEASDRSADLAIVRIDPGDQKLTPLELGAADAVDQGLRVVAMGNPWGLKESVVNGVVSAIREVEGRRMLQLAMPIEPGNSGGPVVDFGGRVVGVVNMKSTVRQNVAFAIQVSDLQRLVESPNPVKMARWATIGAIDLRQWTPLFGADWRQRGGLIEVSGTGAGFGGRSLCLLTADVPQSPFEVGVKVKLDDESGAAGLVVHSDGNNKHYGFYPSAGNLRLSCFRGPTVVSWQVLQEVQAEAYRPGDWNQLRVRVGDGKLECFVNGELVIESTDSSFKSGRVGLAKFRNTNAQFKSFRMGRELPSSEIPDDIVQSIEDLLVDLPPLEQRSQNDLEQLAEAASSSRLLRSKAGELSRRAAEMKRQAAELQSLARDVEVANTAKQLNEVVQSQQPLDLLRGALLIARLEDSDIDIEAYVSRVERMSEEIKKSAEESEESDLHAALKRYLFQENGYHGSRFDYYHRANGCISRLIDDREGLPLTLSVLYMELGKRLGLTIEGVGLPGHFVVRYVPQEGDKQLLDVFNGGNQMSVEDAARLVRERGGMQLTDDHLLATSGRAILSRMLRNLLNAAERDADKEARLRFLEGLVAVDPDSVDTRLRRALSRADTGRNVAAIEDLQWLLDQQPPGLDLQRVREMQEFLRRR